MRVQQFAFAHPQCLVAFFRNLGRCQLALDTKELRPRTFPALFQPVGEHQARDIVSMVRSDGLKEGRFVGIQHRLAPALWTAFLTQAKL